MKNKSALITGSTSGIGLGIAQGLANSGYNIMIHGLMKNRAEEIFNQLEFGKSCKLFYDDTDLSKPQNIAKLIAKSEEALGGIDVLVNNAGLQHVDSIQDFPEEKWDKIMAVNLSSYFHTIKHAIPGMINRRFGRIINIASTHGLVGSAGKSAYVASKHGVLGLTKSVAIEVATHNITCNAICPGFVMTPLVRQQIADIAKTNSQSMEKATEEFIASKHPNKKFVTLEEISAAVQFIINTPSMTGASIVIDGGWTAT